MFPRPSWLQHCFNTIEAVNHFIFYTSHWWTEFHSGINTAPMTVVGGALAIFQRRSRFEVMVDYYQPAPNRIWLSWRPWYSCMHDNGQGETNSQRSCYCIDLPILYHKARGHKREMLYVRWKKILVNGKQPGKLYFSITYQCRTQPGHFGSMLPWGFLKW